jgi:hypothetical protein
VEGDSLPWYKQTNVLTADFAFGQIQPVLPAWATREQGIYAIYPGFRFIPAKVGALVSLPST